MKILNTLLISLLAYSASAQVGIGTSTPTVPLDIEAADAAIDINNTSTDPLIHFQVSGTTNFTIGTDVTDSKFKIGTTALETGTAITVQSTGEVGIGTTSPTATLDVDGSAIFNESGAAVDFRVEGDTEANLLFVDASTDNVGIGTSSPDDKLAVSGGNIILDVDGDGDWVSIGNTGEGLVLSTYKDPTGNEALFIANSSHNIGMGGNISPSFDLDVTGNINLSGSLTNVSDKRFKKDITKIENALSLINQFDGYYYNFKVDEFPKQSFDSTAQIGFIAQEIQKALPQLVSENDSGYLSVNYIKVLPILLMGMKEQQAIIEAQKKEIASEKAENESQKQEIETIKAEASSNTTKTAQKLASLEAKLNALLLLNSKGAVLTAEN